MYIVWYKCIAVPSGGRIFALISSSRLCHLLQLPFLRWKRSAVAAASCILVVRAIVVQLGFYLHMQV